MADYDISNLVAAALARRPADFRDALNGLIVDRAAAAVERYKEDIAQQLISPEDEAEDAEYEGEYDEADDTVEPEVENKVVDDEETE